MKTFIFSPGRDFQYILSDKDRDDNRRNGRNRLSQIPQAGCLHTLFTPDLRPGEIKYCLGNSFWLTEENFKQFYLDLNKIIPYENSVHALLLERRKKVDGEVSGIQIFLAMLNFLLEMKPSEMFTCGPQYSNEIYQDLLIYEPIVLDSLQLKETFTNFVRLFSCATNNGVVNFIINSLT